ncbi:hypothetical protein EG329_001511 [Mollisiaceae sp. DMI_Dod_QoI]|nr:hypothetical protein EG329_001511 [Helotiales sp. DMI_Dod_QoI]
MDWNRDSAADRKRRSVSRYFLFRQPTPVAALADRDPISWTCIGRFSSRTSQPRPQDLTLLQQANCTLCLIASAADDLFSQNHGSPAAEKLQVVSIKSIEPAFASLPTLPTVSIRTQLPWHLPPSSPLAILLIMAAQKYRLRDFAKPSKSSPTLTASSIPSNVEHPHTRQHNRLQLSPADLSPTDISAIIIRYPPCEHHLDFILYPSSESASFDAQSNVSTMPSNNSSCTWDITSMRQCSRQELERYTQCEEDFEKVALGLETQRASRSVLDPQLLEILDSL